MNYTPGPWVGFVDRGFVRAIEAAGRDKEICEFTFEGSPSDEDASLIIASPKLLAVAKILIPTAMIAAEMLKALDKFEEAEKITNAALSAEQIVAEAEGKTQ